MRILGIDPGIGRVGWGVIEVQNSIFKMQSFGCLETDAKMAHEKRLEKLFDEISLIIKEEKPEESAIEELFFNTNAKTAFAVGQGRGVLLLALARNNIPVAVYTPLQVKIALTGYGRAEKNQVGQMVKTILKLASIPKPDDAADGLAIALTHAFSRKVAMVK